MFYVALLFHTIMVFFNVHTHFFTEADDVIFVLNTDTNGEIGVPESVWPLSVGLHPWYLNGDTLDENLNLLRAKVRSLNVIAVGEIGLDRVCDSNFELQLNTFQRQLKIAEENRLPVILHCVRAYSDFLQLLKRQKSLVPWVFHGYNASPETTRALLKFENVYFSVGANVLNASVKLQKSIHEIPINRIFAETDEATVSVKEIYNVIAKLKGVELIELSQSIEQNFLALFSRWTKIIG